MPRGSRWCRSTRGAAPTAAELLAAPGTGAGAAQLARELHELDTAVCVSCSGLSWGGTPGRGVGAARTARRLRGSAGQLPCAGGWRQRTLVWSGVLSNGALAVAVRTGRWLYPASPVAAELVGGLHPDVAGSSWRLGAFLWGL